MSTANSIVKKITSNLQLLKTLRLVFSVAKGLTILTAVLIAIESLAFVLSLYLFRRLINNVIHPGADPSAAGRQIIVCLIECAVVTVLYLVIKVVSTHVTEIQAARVGEYIDDKIHAAAIRLDLAFYESPAYFDILKRAKDAGPGKPNAVVTNLVEAVKSAILLTAIGSVIFVIHWALLPLLVLFIFPAFLVRIRLAHKLHALWQNQTQLERSSSYLSSLITGDAAAKEIKSFALGEYFRAAYLKIRMVMLNERLLINRRSSGAEIATTVLAALCYFACIGYICFRTVQGKSSIGDITIFMVIFPQTFGILQQLLGNIAKLYGNNIFVTNIFELLDLKPSLAEAENPVPIPENDPDIVMKKVSFAYPHSDKPVLKDISLRIPAGKIVAVIGFNGAGKTTLIKLLCRLYDPSSGAITLGGVDIRQFESTAYRRQLSAVFQDFGRYNASAADNIRFGDINSDRPPGDVVAAAEKSGADAFISKLPGGYHTMMGRLFEDGQEVSIGQWQKMAIARAFYSSSRCIIFDEATSALDVVAEKELFELFRQSIGNRSALIISHRLSTVRYADYIYVLSEGQIKQSGTHEELISTEGDYARLFKGKSLAI